MTYRARRGVSALSAALLLSLVSLWLTVHPGLAGSVGPLPPVTSAGGRFGLADVLAGSPPGSNQTWAQLAFNAGARFNRWEFRWDRIEPRPGTWDFSATNADVQSSTSAGLQVVAVLDGTPTWGAASAQPPGNGVPSGLYRSPDDPRNLWAAFVRQTVTQYQGQVRAWEIWNEPDLHFFWNGTPADYYRLLKVSYTVIKSVDPSALVVIAGMVAPGLAFSSQILLDDARDPDANSHNGYFDVAAWHIYGDATNAYTNVTAYRQLLAQYGFGNVPLWVTEDGFPSSNPNGESRQAAYILQTAAYAFAAGASKVFYYRASDDSGPRVWGLMSAAGTFRMGYVALQVASSVLTGASAVTYAPTPSTQRFVFYGKDRRVIVAWSNGQSSQSLKLAGSGDSATLTDWQGNSTQIQSADGQYNLSLPAAGYNRGVDAGNRVVGGPPVILSESTPAAAPPGSPALLLPLPGSSRHVLLFNDGPSAVNARLAALGFAAEHLDLTLPPGAVRDIDLDLLAGSGYGGGYTLTTSAPLIAVAGSSGAAEFPARPAVSWIVPASPISVTLGNPEGRPAVVAVTALGARGVIRVRTRVQIPARGVTVWQLPTELHGQNVSLSLRSATPFVTGIPGGQVFPSQPTWYALRPHGKLTVFNPDSTHAVQIDARFVGSKSLQNVSIRVPPRHTYVFPRVQAAAGVIQASGDVSVGMEGAGPSLLATGAVTDTSLAATGPTRHVAVFNPGAAPVSVSVSLVGSEALATRSVSVPAHVTRYVTVRALGQAPVAVTVHGGGPVVVAPAP